MIKSHEYNNLQMFSRVIFQPKQSSQFHTHDDMIEVFYVLSGKGIFHTKDKEIIVEKDDCIHTARRRTWQHNPFSKPWELLYFLNKRMKKIIFFLIIIIFTSCENNLTIDWGD